MPLNLNTFFPLARLPWRNLQKNQARAYSSFRSNIKFDKPTLDIFASRLASRELDPGSHIYKFNYKEGATDAGVLMPLCVTKEGTPSILFIVRAANMRTHQGEIAFPGGKSEIEDPNPLSTALRETYEEIKISASDIRILGEYATLPNKERTLRVYPFVGWITHPVDPEAIEFNHDEVQAVLCLSIDHLLDPTNRTMMKFRDSSYMYPVFRTPDNIKEELWGLTAFIVDGVLRTILPSIYRSQQKTLL